MSAISLKIDIVESNGVQIMQFEESITINDACQLIRRKELPSGPGQSTEYGLFKPDDDFGMGKWLEQEQTLKFYSLKSGDMLQYRKKLSPLRVRTFDGTIETVLVDDSQTVAELTHSLCSHIGYSNPEELSFVCCAEEMTGQGSRRPSREKKKVETLKKNQLSDNKLTWLNPDKSLKQQGIKESSTLTLRKKFFFSYPNIDHSNPIEVSLHFVQDKDAIVNGTHPCTREEAIQLAALQCQIQYGNYDKTMHKPGSLNLTELLPREYIKIKGAEKNILAEHRKLHDLSETDSKFRYTQLCRSLQTYGATFFLVEEKLRGYTKFMPRLLGIKRESIMRVDKTSKEVLQTWQLTTVRRWAAATDSFMLDFGDYCESYSVLTTEGEAIAQVLAGYIGIIMQKKKSVQMEADKDETEQVTADNVDPLQASKPVSTNSNQGEGETDDLLLKEASMQNHGSTDAATSHQRNEADVRRVSKDSIHSAQKSRNVSDASLRSTKSSSSAFDSDSVDQTTQEDSALQQANKAPTLDNRELPLDSTETLQHVPRKDESTFEDEEAAIQNDMLPNKVTLKNGATISEDLNSPNCKETPNYGVQEGAVTLDSMENGTTNPTDVELELKASKEMIERQEVEIRTLKKQAQALQHELDTCQRSNVNEIERSSHLERQVQAKDREIIELEQKLDDEWNTDLVEFQQSSASWNISRDEVQNLPRAEIGSGAWGVVYSSKFRGEDVAIKQAHRQLLHEVTVNILKREVMIMAHIQHPNLVRFVAAVLDSAVERGTDTPIIISELMDMNLRDAYKKHNLDDCRISLLCDVAYALHYLHQHRPSIIHRDISAPNVLLKALPHGGYRAKVSDFGSANLVKQSRTAAAGAIVYCAPEMFPNSEDFAQPPRPQTTKVDVFSYGVLLLELTVQKMPTPELRCKLLKEAEELSATLYGSATLYELIVQCTRSSPSERPMMADILNILNRIHHYTSHSNHTQTTDCFELEI